MDSSQGETFYIVILSDSLNALEALKDCNHFDRNINKTLTIISELQENGRKVTLVWVPAHVGNPGNEKADALAKAATTREQIDRWIPASIKDVKRAVGHNIIQQWQTRWVSDPRSQHHKTIEKLVPTKSKFQCASRRKEILISKLRIGKCALNKHLFLLKRHPDGKCQVYPQEDENVRHLLMECPAFAHGMSGTVSPEGRNKNPNKSLWDEFHAQQSSKCGPHFQVHFQKSD